MPSPTENAFVLCDKLTAIVPESLEAPVDYENSFADLYDTLILKLKDGAINSYLSTSYWYLFKYIKDGDTMLIAAEDEDFGYRINSGASKAILVRVKDKDLTSAVIPNSVEEGGKVSNVTVISRGVFKDMTSLASLTLPEHLVSILDEAFSGCTSLTEVTMPGTVSEIGEYAFSGTALTEVTLPESVTSVGDGAFTFCTKLGAFYGKFATDDNKCLIVDEKLVSFAPNDPEKDSYNYTIPPLGDHYRQGCLQRQ